MHNIYFTRHGETVWNVENKICGMTDSPLTARGQQQARQLGELVRDSGLHIDEILYSPLSAPPTPQSHCRRYRSACPLRAPPAGAVLWQIRGHAPGRCGVPHLQDPLCRPL